MKKICLYCNTEYIDKANRKFRIRKFCSRLCNSNAHRGWKRNKEQNKEFLEKKYNKKIIKKDGCWDWVGTKNNQGYGMMYHKNKPLRLHRASWIIHYGKIPKNKWVLHQCDNRICSNPDHLYIGNAQDNTDDMIDRGRTNYVKGNISKKRILNNEIVRKIKIDLKDKELKLIEIARKYNCHSGIISEIKKNNIYKEIKI